MLLVLIFQPELKVQHTAIDLRKLVGYCNLSFELKVSRLVVLWRLVGYLILQLDCVLSEDLHHWLASIDDQATRYLDAFLLEHLDLGDLVTIYLFAVMAVLYSDMG